MLGEGAYSLIGGAFDGVVPVDAASVYDVYLYWENVIYGTIQVKIAKPKMNKKLGKTTAKTTIAIQILGEKKVSVKGELDVELGKLEAVAKDGRKLALEFGLNGMTGSFGDYVVDGARNLFSSKDKAEKVSAEAVLAPWLGTFNMFCDAGALSVTVAKKGKVTVKGTVGGEKVSAKSQALIGEEMICIPVVYSKKAVNLAFSLWLPLDGGEVEVVGIDAVVGRAGALNPGAMFRINGGILSDIAGVISSIDGFSLLPEDLSVDASGSKWIVCGNAKAAKVAYKQGVLSIAPGKKGGEIANASGLKLKYKAKDGSFTGSFTVYALEKDKLKKHKASVSGVLVDGVGYGTATIKKLGSWDVTIQQ